MRFKGRSVHISTPGCDPFNLQEAGVTRKLASPVTEVLSVTVRVTAIITRSALVCDVGTDNCARYLATQGGRLEWASESSSDGTVSTQAIYDNIRLTSVTFARARLCACVRDVKRPSQLGVKTLSTVAGHRMSSNVETDTLTPRSPK